MAKQLDSKLVGTVGNLIFYNLNGAYCMRIKPVSVRRTQASVRSGFNFGKASKMSSQIRNMIDPINPNKSDLGVMHRLTGALNKFIGWRERRGEALGESQEELSYIQDFQFNDQVNLSDISAINVSVDTLEQGILKINFSPFTPSESLRAPHNASSILFKIILTDTSMGNIETRLIGSAEIEIPYTNKPFQPPVISLPVAIGEGDLVMMVMAIQYMVNSNGNIEKLNDKKKLPCGIVWAAIGS